MAGALPRDTSRPWRSSHSPCRRSGRRCSTLDFSRRDAFGSAAVTIVVSLGVLAILGWFARRALETTLVGRPAHTDRDDSERR